MRSEQLCQGRYTVKKKKKIKTANSQLKDFQIIFWNNKKQTHQQKKDILKIFKDT